MKRLLLGLTLALMAGLNTAFAEEPANPAIEGTIRDQLDAFQADDFAAAFTFAAPFIQGIFGTPDNFGAMVKNGYPMVWRPGAVKFLDLRAVADGLYQKVAITDQAGVVHVLEYQMIPAGDGWQIGGVQLLETAEIGV